MRTIIARLREEESDLLNDLEAHPVATPEERQEVYHYLSDTFVAASEGIVSFLGEQHERTVTNHGLTLDGEIGGVAMLDILSDEVVFDSGVLEYERLLPSHSIAATCTEDVIVQLARIPEVEAIHDNYIYEISHPELDLLTENTGRGVPSTWQLERLRVDRARSDGNGVKVAVLDTGIDPDHPEFTGTSIAGYMEWDDIGTPMSSGRLRDTHYHGSLVAGVLCGKNIGIAPRVELSVGIIAPKGRASFRQIDRGLDWAAQNGVDIISLSVGKPGYRGEFERFARFAEEAGILVVAAIGNSGPGTSRSPGDYNAFLGVGATDDNDVVWPKSAGGMITGGGKTYPKPDLYAPGVNVWAAIPNGRYRLASGTSVATPAVAGVAALVKAQKPDMPLAELRAHLLASCDSITSPAALGVGDKGYRVSAGNALTNIL